MPDPTPYTYDVFISYSHADSEWVRQMLLPRLEKAGLKVCIDKRDFRPGAFSVKEMERAVLESRNTLLILTPDYANSRWGEFENVMLQTLDPMNEMFRLIPLLKEKCDLPLRLRALTYVNFVDPDDPTWPWAQLLTALGAPPPQEAVLPPAPAAWFLAHPYAMPPNFTGRAAERLMLSRWLAAANPDAPGIEALAGQPHGAQAADNRLTAGMPQPPFQTPAAPLLALTALGGFGKSALVWYWLHHDVTAARWPRVVWWSFYETEATFERFLEETLTYLGIDLRRLPGPRQQADALLAILRSPGALLILDGFERALRAYSSMMAAYQGDAVESANQRISESAEGQKNTQYAIRSTDHATDCISPAAEHFLRGVSSLPGLRSKVLLTTRLTPGVLRAAGGDLLAGCCEVELTEMHPVDAVAFMRGQGIRGGRGEIEAACAPYGYHPLSLRLLAGWIARDLQQPGDIAAANRLDVTGDLVQRRHHVLQTAYDSLTPDRQRLLSRIACSRGPVAYDALAALADTSPSPTSPSPDDSRTVVRRGGQGGEDRRPGWLARVLGRKATSPPPTSPSPDDSRTVVRRGGQGGEDLHDLLDRGLLHRDAKTNRFDLHPIVRRYAYDRLGGADRTASHARLRDYFAALPPVDKPRTLDDLAPVIELYHHTLRAGQYDEARTLFRDRLATPLYFRFGAYQLISELLAGLFPGGDPITASGHAALPRLKDERAQAWTLNALANSYSLSGQPRRAVPLFETMNASFEKRGDKKNFAIGLGNLADDQLKIGALAAAEASLRRRIALGREIGDEFREAVGRQELGRLLAYRGAWDESAAELDAALAMFEKQQDVQSQGIGWAYRALRALLLARDLAPLPSPGPTPSGAGRGEGPGGGVRPARRALELADETARTRYPHERDYVRAHWLLGAALAATGDPSTGSGCLEEAERHLGEALARCRAINMVEAEADILLDLARVRWAALTPDPSPTLRGGRGESFKEEARRLAGEALEITERCGYVLQGADVHLFLAAIALEAGEKEVALAHARAARQLAECDGPPDHTYKVAYDEAAALLAKLGEGGTK